MATLAGAGVTVLLQVYRARAERNKITAESTRTDAETESMRVETASRLVSLVEAQMEGAVQKAGELREELGRALQRLDQCQLLVDEQAERIRQLEAEVVVLRSSGETDAVMRNILDAAPDAMMLINRHGVIEAANRQSERMFRYAPGAMRGVPIDLLVPERFREQHAGHRDDYMDDPKVRPMGVDMVLFALRQDGTEFPVEIGLSPYQVDRGYPKVVASVRDMSERRRST